MPPVPTHQAPRSAAAERTLRELGALRLGAETQHPPLPDAAARPAAQGRDTQQPVAPDSYKRSVQAWAQQIAAVSRRAEAAEARARKLEALLLREVAMRDGLSRRFGQHPKESFEDFVSRLGTVAHTRNMAAASGEAPVLDEVVDLPQARNARRA